MDIYKVLEDLEKAIRESRRMPWPWQDRSVIRRDSFLKLLERSREGLPEEIKQARWVARENQRIRDEAVARAEKVESAAQDRAREMLRSAQEEAVRLVQESEIVARSRQEAQRLMAEAEDRARAREAEAAEVSRKVREEAEAFSQRTRREAEAWSLRVLNGMEGELTRILSIVQRGRENLSGSAPAEPPRGAEPTPREPARPRTASEAPSPPRETPRGRSR
jgi:dTMP kinase